MQTFYDSADYEAYRMIRASLRAQCADRTHLVIGVAPIGMAQGTRVCAALAASFAARGMRVLLLDGVADRPLAGEHVFLQRADVPQPVGEAAPGMDVLSPMRPAEEKDMISTAAYEKIVADAKATYDMVFIDLPAADASADACAAAPLLDGIVVSIAAGQGTRKETAYALRMLHGAGIPLLGMIGVEPPTGRKTKKEQKKS